jgi:hypothetical protein
MDASVAIASWASLLKSGGMSATWFYGRPFFVDNEKANVIYDKIVNKMFKPLVTQLGPKERIGWLRSSSAIRSRLDNIAFPADTWEHVERIKWNTEFPMDFYDLKECGIEPDIDLTSAVTSDEKTEEKQDPGFWAAHWTVPDVRRFIEVIVPMFSEGQKDHDEELEALYMNLEEALGGKEVKAQIGWPVSLLLATKK